MSRSPSESSLFFVPRCGTQTPPPQASVQTATVMLDGPVNVELAGRGETAGKRQNLSTLVELRLKRKFGEPAGGCVAPSTSDGKRLAKLVLSWKQTMVAA